MTYPRNSEGTYGMSTLQKAARLVGAVFLLVGIAGFIPGLTTDYDSMEFAGHESHAQLLGLFEVSVLHNIVHLLFGLAGLLLSRTYAGARGYLIGGGIIYFLLFLYGLVVDKGDAANFVPLNHADDWLHLVLSVVMIGLGLALGRDRIDSGRTDHTANPPSAGTI